MKEVIIPAQFTIATTHPFSRLIVSHDGYPVDPHIVFDFGQLRWIDGSGLTVLCNALGWLHSHGVQCQFTNHTGLQRQAISYLDDCGLFRTYLGQSLSSHSQVRGTTLPFTAVPHAEAHGWLANDFTPWMAYTLGVQPESLGSLRTCIKEVFNNILDHSTKDTGFIHLQHYYNLSRVKITVSDFGIGIPNSMRAKFGPMNDVQAILKASWDGVTSQTQPNNQGAGLAVMIDYVVRAGGAMGIYSYGGGLHSRQGHDGRPTREPTAGNGSYPGTIVDVSLNTAAFVGDEVENGTVEW